MTAIVTHRGLDPSKPNYYTESSIEAFADQLARGFGLEFDLRQSKDGVLVVSHDSNLKRLSGGHIDKEIEDLTWEEMSKMDFRGSHLIDFDGLLNMISAVDDKRISAIHLKHQSQSKKIMDEVATKVGGDLKDKFIIFDLKPESAAYLKEKNKNLHLAASVSHPCDIERYNSCVGGTLISVKDVIKMRDLFDWVWLDEWDRKDFGEHDKTLYNRQVFDNLRGVGFKIALVSPELHGISPGLMGGEAHPDASNSEILHSRMKEIAILQPDVVCTDFPDIFLDIVQGTEIIKLNKK